MIHEIEVQRCFRLELLKNNKLSMLAYTSREGQGGSYNPLFVPV